MTFVNERVTCVNFEIGLLLDGFVYPIAAIMALSFFSFSAEVCKKRS